MATDHISDFDSILEFDLIIKTQYPNLTQTWVDDLITLTLVFKWVLDKNIYYINYMYTNYYYINYSYQQLVYYLFYLNNKNKFIILN